MKRIYAGLALPLVGWLLFGLGYVLLISSNTTNWQNTIIVLSPGIVFSLTWYIFKFHKNVFQNSNLFTKHADIIDQLPDVRLPLWIALAAGLGLYLELMMIRLHASYFQLFAYFKNVSLLSCFLGLGIGYANGSRKPLTTPLAFPLIALQILFLSCLRHSEMNMRHWLQNPICEQLAFGIRQATEFNYLIFVYGFIILVFSFNTLCFIPFGQLVSRLMLRQEKLRSYNWNLIGSLVGLCLFSFLSFLWCPPAVWVLIATLALLLIFKNDSSNFVLTAVIGAVISILISIPLQVNRFDIYSPYQILTMMIEKDGTPVVKVSNTFYQSILNLSDEHVSNNKDLQAKQNTYDAPYKFKEFVGNALVVGAGTGNDVAAAIRHGAESIDAVEIDPVILQWGKHIHPESPYQNKMVATHVDDARSFIRHAHKAYDMIIYGLLDSHVLLSGRSAGIRLDSYIYTVEAFREARKRLKADGSISLTFNLSFASDNNKAFGQKIFSMLKEAFDGKNPVVIKTGRDVIFIAGESIEGTKYESMHGEIIKDYEKNKYKVDVSTDDWPFLYMTKRQYPFSYMVLIIFLLMASIILTKGFIGESAQGFSFPCFFLGAGFMLLETKAITELALVYGSTWFVVCAVIAAILIMALLANQLIIKKGSPNALVVYIFLCGSIALGLWGSSLPWANTPAWINKLLMTGLLTIPLFFSGFAFSHELKKAPSVAVALSSNLWGAMLGGFLEYNSMYFGFRSLYFLAIFMYALSFFSAKKLQA